MAWHFTSFYRDTDTSKRQRSWDMLHQLKNNNLLPWMCAGDFNEILSDEEKMGDLRLARQMENFRVSI